VWPLLFGLSHGPLFLKYIAVLPRGASEGYGLFMIVGLEAPLLVFYEAIEIHF